MKTFLSTEGSRERHARFPLLSHPVDAINEAFDILQTVEPISSGVYCSIRTLSTTYYQKVDTTPYEALVEGLQIALDFDPYYHVPEAEQFADYLENLALAEVVDGPFEEQES